MSEVSGQATGALLEARDVKKYFGAITALNGVSFHVSAGEALGVVGDNGAGKSTLMKILSGLYKPSEGSLYFQGQPVKFDSPRDARQMGIEMVYQDFALAGNMPIYENIYLGREPGRKFAGLTIIDREQARQMAEGASRQAEDPREEHRPDGRRSCPAASARRWRSPARPLSTPRS